MYNKKDVQHSAILGFGGFYMIIKLFAAVSVLTATAVGIMTGAFSGLAWLWVLPVTAIGTFLVLAAAFFLLLVVSCEFVRLDRPQQKDSGYYRWLMDLAEEAALTILGVRLEKRGMENIPGDGRFLLVSNHIHDLDPLVLHQCFRKSQLAFITKRENCTMFLVGKFMHKTLCQPINRENDREALKTIIKCIQILKDDQASVAVFPEGYTSMDRKLHSFRSGVFKIAQKAQVPIVVCTVQNTYKVFGNFKKLRPTTVKVHLVDVIPAQELQGVTTVEIAERVHRLMADDLGPELVLQEN